MAKKLCVEDPSHGPQVTRSRCHDCWVRLVTAECRASRQVRKIDRRIKLFMAARLARQEGDVERQRFIVRNRKLPEEVFTAGLPRKRGKILMGNRIERTFVSDIELDNGTGDWHGFDYFGDVSRDNWPELERYGLGGRDLRHIPTFTIHRKK